MEITGNITADLNLEHTPSGVPYVKFRVAQNTSKMVDGERVDGSTLFFNVTAWRALAEGIVNALGKGSPVVGVGKWEASDYKKDGEERHSQWIVAEALGPDLRRIDATLQRRSAKKPEKAAVDPFEED